MIAQIDARFNHIVIVFQIKFYQYQKRYYLRYHEKAKNLKRFSFGLPCNNVLSLYRIASAHAKFQSLSVKISSLR